MNTISYTTARADLAKTMEKVCQDHAPVTITRQNAPSVVMMSLEDYEAIEETMHLLRNPANAARLTRALQDIEGGQATERELL